MAGLRTRLVWLLLLGLGSGEAGAQTAGSGPSVVAHLRVDVRRKQLVWNVSDHVISQDCLIETPEQPPTWQDPREEGGNVYSCSFPNAVLHQGATFTVNGSSSQGAFQARLVFSNEGRQGSAAVNFSCIIYAIHSMNCSWAPGPTAPADIRYHLYFWTSWDQAKAEECAQYVLNAAGTPTGCLLAQLPEPSRGETYFFMITGTSTHTTIPFVDFPPFQAVMLEKYNTPGNLRTHFNGTHHIIEWDNPHTRFEQSVHILLYEIHLQRKGGQANPEQILQRGKDSNVYLLPGAAARRDSTVRIRVRHVYGRYWSDWTRQLSLGTPEPDPSDLQLLLIAPAVGVAALSVTVFLFLCQRASLRQKLFPHIPQVRRDLVSSLDAPPQVTWEENPDPQGPQEHEYVMLDEIEPLSRGADSRGQP